MSEFALLKHVARGIRYRSLTEFSDVYLTIDGWDNIENLLRTMILQLLPSIGLTEFSPSNPIAFLRYGLLDVGFTVSESALSENYIRGVKLLHQFGWLSTTFEDGDELSCLQVFHEDIVKNIVYLRMYLKAHDTVPPYESEFLYSEAVDSEKADYVMQGLAHHDKLTYDFPNNFQVEDAFLTNVSNIGLWKHFYL